MTASFMGGSCLIMTAGTKFVHSQVVTAGSQKLPGSLQWLDNINYNTHLYSRGVEMKRNVLLGINECSICIIILRKGNLNA